MLFYSLLIIINNQYLRHYNYICDKVATINANCCHMKDVAHSYLVNVVKGQARVDMSP